MAGRPELYHLPGFDEPFSSMSHLLAAALFVWLGWKLLRHGQGSRSRILFLSIYSLSCVFLFSMSGVLHMLKPDGTASDVLNRIDHGAIFVLIAGTFTGVHGIAFGGWFRWIPLALVWAVAITAITLKTVFFNGFSEWFGLVFYIGLSWGVAMTGIPIFKRHGFACLWPLIAGGAAYSLGALSEYMGWFILIPGVVHEHEVWHLMVMAGALLHWRFVWNVTGGLEVVDRTRTTP